MVLEHNRNLRWSRGKALKRRPEVWHTRHRKCANKLRVMRNNFRLQHPMVRRFPCKAFKCPARHDREAHSRGKHKQNEAHSRYLRHAGVTPPLGVGNRNLAPSAKYRNSYNDLPKISHRHRIQYSTRPPRGNARCLQKAKLSTCRNMARVFQTADSLVDL